MIVEKQIEDKVVENLNAAFASVSGVSVVGTWSSTPAGTVKGDENASSRAFLAVAVSEPVFDTYTTPTCTCNVALVLAVRQETAPTAAEIETLFDPIESLIVSWQMDEGASRVSDDLSTKNFSASGVRLTSGDAPRFDSSRHVWQISRGFAIRGIISAY